MEPFPKRWLPIIGKHVREQLGLPSDAPLPADVERQLQQLTTLHKARASSSAAKAQ